MEICCQVFAMKLVKRLGKMSCRSRMYPNGHHRRILEVNIIKTPLSIMLALLGLGDLTNELLMNIIRVTDTVLICPLLSKMGANVLDIST